MFIKFFEHIRVGEQTDLGSHEFTADEMVGFAGRFDPQPFHVDAQKAAESHFGALCASGWHTAAICQRLTIARRTALAAETNPPQRGFHARLGPSPGFRQLQWLRPVYVGDTIDFASRVVDKTELHSRPDWGLVTCRSEGRDRNSECVFGVTVQLYVERTSA